ncbi:hypothetical protein Tco_0160466, partial [Tanacetum coccineum]
MVWIGWDKILASKKNRGLGISSLYATNRSLLFKWVWRFLTQESSLWSRFIKASHGTKEAMDVQNLANKGSIWLPRGGIESEQYRNLSDAVSDIILPKMHDRWSWSLNALGEFS